MNKTDTADEKEPDTGCDDCMYCCAGCDDELCPCCTEHRCDCRDNNTPTSGLNTKPLADRSEGQRDRLNTVHPPQPDTIIRR